MSEPQIPRIPLGYKNEDAWPLVKQAASEARSLSPFFTQLAVARVEELEANRSELIDVLFWLRVHPHIDTYDHADKVLAKYHGEVHYTEARMQDDEEEEEEDDEEEEEEEEELLQELKVELISESGEHLCSLDLTGEEVSAILRLGFIKLLEDVLDERESRNE